MSAKGDIILQDIELNDDEKYDENNKSKKGSKKNSLIDINENTSIDKGDQNDNDDTDKVNGDNINNNLLGIEPDDIDDCVSDLE